MGGSKLVRSLSVVSFDNKPYSILSYSNQGPVVPKPVNAVTPRLRGSTRFSLRSLKYFKRQVYRCNKQVAG